jgi:predicted nuclease of predicted toxin-antitoxin system
MKILLDECVPRKLKPHLSDHLCRTVSEAGFSGMKNGILLRLAEAEGYDALVTIDRGMETQQNRRGRRISVVILVGRSGRLKDLVLLVPNCLRVLATLEPGQVRRVEG